jgi:hypothetical protein
MQRPSHLILLDQELSQLRPEMTERGILIATYALCGFANLGSMGIQVMYPVSFYSLSLQIHFFCCSQREIKNTDTCYYLNLTDWSVGWSGSIKEACRQ